jgi:hypothetical protein
VAEKECCPTDYEGNPLVCQVPDGQQVGTCQNP